MPVDHPAARNGGGPAAYTYGSETYPIRDGAVQCPSELEGDIADALAERFDVDAASLTGDTEAEAEPDTCQTVKSDNEVCGRELPCAYHSD